jgi:hypothetical protein
MALKQVSGHHTGTDEASSQHSHGSSKCSADNHAATANAGVFNPVAFQA